jgi:DNA primase
VEIYLENLGSDKKINTDFFIQHSDAKVSELTIHLLSVPYEYSHNWEKLNVFLTSQKMPDDNHVADAKSGILRFKLRKFERVMEKNQQEIKGIQEAKGDFEELMTLLKVQSRLIQLRGEIAKQLNTVVLK